MTGEVEDGDVTEIEVQIKENRGSYENGETTQKAWEEEPGRRDLGGGAWEVEQMRGKWMLLQVGQQGTRKSGFYFIFEAKKSFTNS